MDTVPGTSGQHPSRSGVLVTRPQNDWSSQDQFSARHPETQPGHIPVPPVPNSICVSRQAPAAPGWWQTIRLGTQRSTGSTTHRSGRAQINGKHPLAKYNTARWFVRHFHSDREFTPHIRIVSNVPLWTFRHSDDITITSPGASATDPVPLTGLPGSIVLTTLLTIRSEPVRCRAAAFSEMPPSSTPGQQGVKPLIGSSEPVRGRTRTLP